MSTGIGRRSVTEASVLPKHVYVVFSGEWGSVGQIENLAYRLSKAKRLAHKLIGVKHGDYGWVNPNKDHGEVCRWQAKGSGDFVSIIKHKIT